VVAMVEERGPVPPDSDEFLELVDYQQQLLT
jgi:hypothetical protein